MEEVLHRPALRRGCVLEKNSLGLYDLTIREETGETIVEVKSISFLRAVGIIEENMYANGRKYA